LRFNGNRCRHYTEANSTDSTRVSFDFRVIPRSLWRADHKGLIGDYAGGCTPVRYRVLPLDCHCNSGAASFGGAPTGEKETLQNTLCKQATTSVFRKLYPASPPCLAAKDSYTVYRATPQDCHCNSGVNRQFRRGIKRHSL
jgi:hypothetical protein